MRRVLLAMAVAAAVGGFVYADDAPPAQLRYAQAVTETAVTGFVKEVYPNNRTIAVTAPDSTTLIFNLNADTRIVSEVGRYLVIGDLQAGQTVTVTYIGTLNNPYVIKVLLHAA